MSWISSLSYHRTLWRRSFRLSCLPICCAFLLIVCGAQVARAATFTVNTTADTTDNTCDATSCTLREAIKAANDAAGDDIIAFDAATFDGSPQTINLSRALPRLSTNIELRGPSAGRLTVRRAANTGEFRIFNADNGNGPESGPTVSISDLSITNGSAGIGAGILNTRGNLTVQKCAITGNRGLAGAGIENVKGTVTVRNCTITGNTTQNIGGGIYNFAGTMMVQNCTVSGNSSGQNGGGIDSIGEVTVQNCIVAGNTSPGDSNLSGFFSGSHNITSGTAAEAGLEVDSAGEPILKDNGGPTQTIALMPGSPALNAGNDATAPATDQRGYARNGMSDIGAFEFNGTPPVPYRVDALIKKDGETARAYGPDNVYQQSPVHQQVQEQTVGSGSTAIYYVKVQNDTNDMRTFGVHAGEGGGAGWTVVYKRGATNISSAMRSTAGYTTGTLAPGASEVITIRMTPAAGASANKSATLKVFLGSDDKVTRDAVQAITSLSVSLSSG